VNGKADRAVIPAKAGIQYCRDGGVLDRPVKPDDDSVAKRQ
jgi:hypothetical protein